MLNMELAISLELQKTKSELGWGLMGHAGELDLFLPEQKVTPAET